MCTSTAVLYAATVIEYLFKMLVNTVNESGSIL